MSTLINRQSAMPIAVFGDYHRLLAELVGSDVDSYAFDLEPSVRTPLIAFPELPGHPTRHNAETAFKDCSEHVACCSARTSRKRMKTHVRNRQIGSVKPGTNDLYDCTKIILFHLPPRSHSNRPRRLPILGRHRPTCLSLTASLQAKTPAGAIQRAFLIFGSL